MAEAGFVPRDGKATCGAAPDPMVLSLREAICLVVPEKEKDDVPLGLGYDSVIPLTF